MPLNVSYPAPATERVAPAEGIEVTVDTVSERWPSVAVRPSAESRVGGAGMLGSSAVDAGAGAAALVSATRTAAASTRTRPRPAPGRGPGAGPGAGRSPTMGSAEVAEHLGVQAERPAGLVDH